MRQPITSPPIKVETMRDAYGHIARQECRCGESFVVEDEKVVADKSSGDVCHIMIARCKNSDCNTVVDFPMNISTRLVVGGLGLAMMEGIRPLNPAHTFPCVSVGVQAGVGLVSAWLAARATGVGKESLDAIIHEAVKHSGGQANLLGNLQRIGSEFDTIVSELERGLGSVQSGG